MTNDEVSQQKEIEFYAASVNAWYTSALEHDKSVFALAGGGIALLITLLTTVGFEGSLTLTLFFIAIISFLVTLGCLLWVFHGNQNYIEKTLKTGSLVSDRRLQTLDLTAQFAFGIGVLFASAVGFSAAWSAFEKRQCEKENIVTNKTSPPGKSAQTFDSVNGAARLQTELTKSFHGAGGLQPSASMPAPAPASSTPVATPAVAQPSQTQSGAPPTGTAP